MPKVAAKCSRKFKKGERIAIPAAQVEFVNGGDTIWIHGPDGSTILRLKIADPKCSVVAESCNTSPVPHGDAMLVGHVTICIPNSK